MQYTLSSVTKLCTHWICGPILSRMLQDFCERAYSCSVLRSPAPGRSRSITNLGMMGTLLLGQAVHHADSPLLGASARAPENFGPAFNRRRAYPDTLSRSQIVCAWILPCPVQSLSA